MKSIGGSVSLGSSRSKTTLSIAHYVGDLVCCYAQVIKIGRSSITIKVQVWTIRMRIRERAQVTEGVFTYVALDEMGRSKPVQWEIRRR